MRDRSHVLPKGQRGRPRGPAKTDAFRENQLFIAIASAHRGPGIRLLCLSSGGSSTPMTGRGTSTKFAGSTSAIEVISSGRSDMIAAATRRPAPGLGSHDYSGLGAHRLEWLVSRQKTGGWRIDH